MARARRSDAHDPAISTRPRGDEPGGEAEPSEAMRRADRANGGPGALDAR